MYRYGNEVYVQGDRGPIGHVITCIAARVIMLWFNINFLELVRNLGLMLVMFQRYVDDVNAAVIKIKDSMTFDEDKCMMIDNAPGEERDLMTDEQMMEILKNVANKVTKMIRWEQDYPSFHPDGELPMLDIKIHLDKTDELNPIKFRYIQKQWQIRP